MKQFNAQIGGSFVNDTIAKIKNLIPASDENARPAFSGEHHNVLLLPNGKYSIANFMGPGTKIVQRLERNDPPRTMSDKVAQRHDIDYMLAKDVNDIRVADNRMLKKINEIDQKKLDNKFNTNQAKLIALKMKAEDIGVLSKGSFGDLNHTHTDQERAILENAKANLEQQGFGMSNNAELKKLIKQNLRKLKKKLKKEKKPPPPSHRLKQMIISQIKSGKL